VDGVPVMREGGYAAKSCHVVIDESRPERGRTCTIRQTGTDGITMDVVEGVDLKADGIQPGDWFIIHAIEHGLKITVPCDYAWRAETMQAE
jgi:hypothetical protein